MLSPNSTFTDVVIYVIHIINLIIPVLVTLALAVFLWGGVRYIFKSQDSHGKGHERDALVWGVISLFIIFSIWGILGILSRTLLGSPRTSSGTSSQVGEPMNILPPGANGEPINILPPGAR